MKNKVIINIFLLFFAFAIFTFGYLKINKAKATVYFQSPVIWYVPHPDDETLFMGGSIKKYDLAGHRNIIILFTRGGASSAIFKVNAKLEKKLTHDEFEEARIREFFAAVSHLGIQEEDIIFYNFPDGHLGAYEDNIYQVILNMERQYPNAIHNSMSYYDMHTDHRTIGKALLNAYNKKNISNANFYLNQSQFDLNGSYVVFTNDMKKAKIAALKEYKYYNVSEGRYAIGYASVPEKIDTQISNPKEKIHKPND